MQQQRGTRWVIGLMGVCVLATTIVTTGLAQAASGNGPYYAEPSWSQKLPAATRFVVLTDWNSEAVLDRETGLVWEKSPATTMHDWDDALSQCTARTTGGRMGWRLPSVHELASLIDPAVAFPGPTLPPGHPFVNVQSGATLIAYWSASTDSVLPTSARLVTFHGGVGRAGKSGPFHAWCVRGGNNADAY